MKDVWYLKIKEGKLKRFTQCNIKFLYNMKEVLDLLWCYFFLHRLHILFMCIIYVQLHEFYQIYMANIERFLSFVILICVEYSTQ